MADSDFKFCTACGNKVASNAQFCTKCGVALGARGKNVKTERILGIVGSVIQTCDTNGIPLKESVNLSTLFTGTQLVFLHMEPPKDRSIMAKTARVLTTGVAQMMYDGYKMQKAGKAYELLANAIQTYDSNELLLSDERNFAIPYSDIERIDIKRPRISKTWGARMGQMNIVLRPGQKSAALITLTFKLGYQKTTVERIKAEDVLLAQLQSSILSGKLFVRPWSR
jgi:hypothetical protein